MRRADIPVQLRTTRAADCAKIPDAALAKMTPADVETRLQAADEFRRRAAVPHLDGDLLRGRLDLAREVLTTTDPRRATTLAKAAGVPSYTLRDGTKIPTGDEHELRSAIDAAKRDHRSGRPGDDPAFRSHLIARAKALNVRGAIPASWAGNATSKSAVSKAARIDQGPALARARQRLAEIQRRPRQVERARPAATPARPAAAGTGYGRLAKSAAAARPERSITVPTPALDTFNSAKSFMDGMNTLLRRGYLGIAAKELAAVAAASAEVRGESGHLAKAAHYERQAAVMTSPADRSAYLQLAAQEREKVGTA